MTDDEELVTVELDKRAVDNAHTLARMAGYEGLTDRKAVEAAIAAHVAEFEAILSKAGGIH